jgi:hypothetical protein
MRYMIACLLGALSIAQGAVADPFPHSAKYYVFIQGVYSGTSAFQAREDGKFLLIDAKTRIKFNDEQYELKSHTKLHRKTYKPISFRFEGTKPGQMQFEGIVKLERDTIFGDLKINGEKIPSMMPVQGADVLFFENYEAAHEVVLARAYLEPRKEFKAFVLFYPSDFMKVDTKVTTASEEELEITGGSIVCTKLMVLMTGSVPFYSYLDMNKNIPIYLDFPASSTEYFLDGYFALDDIRPKYQKAKK